MDIAFLAQKAAASYAAAAFYLSSVAEPIASVGLGSLELREVFKVQVEEVAAPASFSEPDFIGSPLARFGGVTEGVSLFRFRLALCRSGVGEADAAKQQQQGKTLFHHRCLLKQFE
ncbi:hypothetical protein [Hymenobacter glaciei]|uniref:hypothetical protein n=1 Tax=Hymenobacter glaciei TaxID=877209 RepID=UPI0031EF26C4